MHLRHSLKDRSKSEQVLQLWFLIFKNALTFTGFSQQSLASESIALVKNLLLNARNRKLVIYFDFNNSIHSSSGYGSTSILGAKDDV